MPHRAQIFGSFDEFYTGAPRLVEARPVVSVGSFDGVHLGHQYLLAELIEWARREHAPAVVVTFRRHPREYMLNIEIPSLNTPEHKARLLSKAGVDAVVMLDFDENLRQLSAGQFMSDCIKQKVGARAMLVGFNNRIGKDGEGTFEVLREIGREIDIEVREGERVEVSGEAMSSSAIRKHVANGDFLWARKMLGRPYSLVGTVQEGDKRGRTIGFPTANIALKGLGYPPQGVYGVRTKFEGTWYLGAANIGTRPTVDPDRREPLLEVHVLDFDGDLYDKEIEVEFLFHVRGEKKFNSLDELKEQLQKDVAEIRQRADEEEYD
ncbi:MAG: riboflavin biosynthesis protein RibF [Planctomycetes bacterium]|nr:riboflavin biosynthesis protein RibF [Planctomycetota bacterium]